MELDDLGSIQGGDMTGFLLLPSRPDELTQPPIQWVTGKAAGA
jgi:hypothetical protein